jgi:hypothetical protein
MNPEPVLSSPGICRALLRGRPIRVRMSLRLLEDMRVTVPPLSTREQRGRRIEPKRLRGLEVDHNSLWLPFRPPRGLPVITALRRRTPSKTKPSRLPKSTARICGQERTDPSGTVVRRGVCSMQGAGQRSGSGKRSAWKRAQNSRGADQGSRWPIRAEVWNRGIHVDFNLPVQHRSSLDRFMQRSRMGGPSLEPVDIKGIPSTPPPPNWGAAQRHSARTDFERTRQLRRARGGSRGARGRFGLGLPERSGVVASEHLPHIQV